MTHLNLFDDSDSLARCRSEVLSEIRSEIKPPSILYLSGNLNVPPGDWRVTYAVSVTLSDTRNMPLGIFPLEWYASCCREAAKVHLRGWSLLHPPLSPGAFTREFGGVKP